MMNELLDKGVGVQYPEEQGGTIDLQTVLSLFKSSINSPASSANCCKFNRWGSLVAVGAIDGRVFICDFLTQKIVKVIIAHALPISSLCWSRDGRTLLTASSDTTVKVWNVLEGVELNSHLHFKYGAVVITALFNPRNDNQFVVLLNNLPPVVETINPRGTKVMTNDVALINTPDDGVCALSYDRRGKYIITGTSKGKLLIYDAKTIKLVTWVKQQNFQQVRQIYTPRKGNFILTNTQDRVIRVYRLEDILELPKGNNIEPLNKVLDIVNKQAWKSVCTDMDGNYICGASTKAHQLYIWERMSGTLMKILNGAKGETILDAQWHPTRPVILSVSNGQVSVWTQTFVENWSAFAPDFTELEENLKYHEKEGEFDEFDEDASVEDKQETKEEDDEEIDVETYKPNELLCSSDEEDVNSLVPDVTLQSGPLWFLPQPEIENPEQLPLNNRETGPIPRLPYIMAETIQALGIGAKPRRTK